MTMETTPTTTKEHIEVLVFSPDLTVGVPSQVLSSVDATLAKPRLDRDISYEDMPELTEKLQAFLTDQPKSAPKERSASNDDSQLATTDFVENKKDAYSQSQQSAAPVVPTNASIFVAFCRSKMDNRLVKSLKDRWSTKYRRCSKNRGQKMAQIPETIVEEEPDSSYQHGSSSALLPSHPQESETDNFESFKPSPAATHNQKRRREICKEDVVRMRSWGKRLSQPLPSPSRVYLGTASYPIPEISEISRPSRLVQRTPSSE